MDYNVAIIGGGASGLACALALNEYGVNGVLLLDGNDRVGRKLAATGNGQGNLTNINLSLSNYHSYGGKADFTVDKIISEFNNTALIDYFYGLGVITEPDNNGRVYPISRQASSLTDVLRFAVGKSKVEFRLSVKALSIETGVQRGGGFTVTLSNGTRVNSKYIVLCTGGKSAKNFGTDGNGYALAESLGHTITKLQPSLVQLKTLPVYKVLKGFRANASVTLNCGGEKTTVDGDVIFTDYGISGNAIFQLSAYYSQDKKSDLTINFLPNVERDKLKKAIENRITAQMELSSEYLLCGLVANQLARAILSELSIPFTAPIGELGKAVDLIIEALYCFKLSVTGTLGYDYSQVTKGGVPLSECTEALQSKLRDNLYFAGEILDVDGDCGGYNLQWAFSSGRRVARDLSSRLKNDD